MSVRILHLADSHIGADLPMRAGGRYRRGGDLVDSHQRAVARAFEFGVDLVIHAGDLFDSPSPSQGALAAACEPLWKVALAGIPVIVVPGNHERSILPHALLLAHENIHVVREPRTFVFPVRETRVAVAAFPCVRRGAAGAFADAVTRTRWHEVRANLNILAVHQTFESARCSPGNYQFRDGDDVIPRSAIPAGFHYVAAGHIHRHQVLSTGAVDGPPLVYAGAPDRISFAEIGEPKGCVLVEFADGRAQPRFIEHPVRPMALLSINVTDCTGATVVDRVLEQVRALADSAVVLIRLSGQAPRRALAGLKLTQQIRAVRPDVLATVSSQAVEWISDRAEYSTPTSAPRSAFDVLQAPPTPLVSATAADVASLPACCGTYALYDAAGRLLYVGKVRHVRARVRTHLRGSSPSGYFAAWSDQIARVEVRPAASELEALLVEAELIRRLGPAFNRQMRSWKRYCYLCAPNLPFGQLRVCAEPVRGGVVFGPLRSRASAEAAQDALSAYFGLAHCPTEIAGRHQRLLPPLSPAHLCERYFAGRCTGPCAGRIESGEYAARIRSRDALLAGGAAEKMAAAREEFDGLKATPDADEATAGRVRLLQTVIALHERAVLLRHARALLDRALYLPGPDGACMVATIGHRGLRLELRPTVENIEGGVEALHPIAEHGSPPKMNFALPKPVADCLCIVVQHLRRTAPAAATRPGSSA